MVEEKGTLKEGEFHPIAPNAMFWYNSWALDIQRHLIMKESLASTAIEGNRTSEILLETMDRIDRGDKVSDRYLFGLVWFLRNALEEENAKKA